MIYLMMTKIFKAIGSFFKTNIVFGLGMIVGSAIGTCTTIAITMGLYGALPTLEIYRQAVCGG